MNVMHHKVGRDPHYKIWHAIDGAMILFVYSGDGSIVLKDRIYPLQRGTLCLITPDRLHYTMPEDPESYDRSKIFISTRVYRSLIESFGKNERFVSLFEDENPVYARIPDDKFGEVEYLFRRAEKRMLDGDGEESIIGSFFSLLDYLVEYTGSDAIKKDTMMSRAIGYINKNLRGPITLDMICENLHVSKYHFSRKFKMALGMTVMEYIIKTRLAQAEELLIYTLHSIGEISERSGFSDLAYFSRTFKALHGLTPREYRKLYKKRG